MKKIMIIRIKAARESKKLNQAQLGIGALGFTQDETNKAQKVISKIEIGEREVSATELYNIAKFLNKPIKYFFGEERDENKTDQHCEIACDEKIKDLCLKVKKVVESGTHWGGSLEANIKSFASGLEQDENIKELKRNIADLRLATPKKGTGKKKVM